MAKQTKTGVDPQSREGRRRLPSGYLCVRCGEMVSQGDLCMVRILKLGANGTGRRQEKRPYHRKCYAVAG